MPFIYVLLWLLSRYKGRIAVSETIGLAELKYLLFGPLQKKKMLTSDLNNKDMYYLIK